MDLYVETERGEGRGEKKRKQRGVLRDRTDEKESIKKKRKIKVG